MFSLFASIRRIRGPKAVAWLPHFKCRFPTQAVGPKSGGLLPHFGVLKRSFRFR